MTVPKQLTEMREISLMNDPNVLAAILPTPAN